MDAELAQKWIDALESGRYQKGKRTLCFNGHYCCLGVLADMQGDLTMLGSDGIAFDCFNSLPDGAYGMSWEGEMSELAVLNDTTEGFEPVIAEIRRRFIEPSS